jgi:hypothetical protein
MEKDFNAALKLNLAPRLRACGFKGSGRLFRRVTGVVCHALTIQSARDGGRCCVELGVHLTFLPTPLEQPIDQAKFSAYDCEFRTRLAPSGREDVWWAYGTSADDSVGSASSLIATVESAGMAFFERFAAFPRDFTQLQPEALRRGDLSSFPPRLTSARAALAAARIAAYAGDLHLAAEFCNVGIELGGTATLFLGRVRAVQAEVNARLRGEPMAE